jgi:hypothetical protein
MKIRLRKERAHDSQPPRRMIVWVSDDVSAPLPAWIQHVTGEQDRIFVSEPRGTGGSQWTRKNPPNYVARSHYLLGRTVDSGRIWDIVATARYFRASLKEQCPVYLVAETNSAVLAIYAALLEPDIAGLIVRAPPATHMDSTAPTLLNVLRVCDIPDALGMVAPRPVTLLDDANNRFQKAAAIYRVAGASEKLVVKK